MKNKIKNKEYLRSLKEMKTYLLLWSTQSFSGLGSAMTSYALVIWSYTQEGDHAGVRYAGGGKHGGYADSAEK